MKIHNVTQGSTQWLNLRAGIPTASEFDQIITPEWKPRTGQTPETYLYRKLAEKCMGIPLQEGGSWAMNQGSLREMEAIPFFEFTYEQPIQRIGFITTDEGDIGCSPDGLLGTEGGIEVKCPQPDTHLRYLCEGVLPKQYAAQVYGSMLVTSRPWWIFMSYSRQFPAFVLKVHRNEPILAKLSEALDGFLEVFKAQYAKITALRDAENAVKSAAYEKANP